jgi:hypothetical protein
MTASAIAIPTSAKSRAVSGTDSDCALLLDDRERSLQPGAGLTDGAALASQKFEISLRTWSPSCCRTSSRR